MATPILLLAANAPDIDIVTASGGSLSYLHYHRHLTHSLVAMPLMAVLPVVLVRLVGRKSIHWIGAFCAALIAVASHLLLDWTNAYGIRLFLPFSGRWLRLDLNNLFDLWIWAVFLLAILAPLVGRLVGSEITSRAVRNPYHGRAAACVALAFLLLYECGRASLHARAVATLESRLYQDSDPLRVAALPGSANPWRWRGVVETSDFFAVEDLDLMADFDPTHAMIFHKPVADPAIEAAQRIPAVQEFLRFSQIPLWEVSPASNVENGRLVEVFDLRFGTPVAPGFMARTVLDSRLQPIESSMHWGISRPR